MDKVFLITADEKIGPLLARFLHILLPDAIVERFSDGLEALSAAAAEQPDLIILDSQLPRLPADAIASFLLWDAATRHIPIIGTGPQHKDKSALRLFRLTDAWIAKPTPLNVLSNAIETVMRQRRPETWSKTAADWLRLPQHRDRPLLAFAS